MFLILSTGIPEERLSASLLAHPLPQMHEAIGSAKLAVNDSFEKTDMMLGSGCSWERFDARKTRFLSMRHACSVLRYHEQSSRIGAHLLISLCLNAHFPPLS